VWDCQPQISSLYRDRARDPEVAFSDLPALTVEMLADTSPLPEELAIHQSTRTMVLEVLARLPANYARALVLRYADGCSVDEVAQTLKRSYKSTESLLHRAREAFRGQFIRARDEVRNG